MSDQTANDGGSARTRERTTEQNDADASQQSPVVPDTPQPPTVLVGIPAYNEAATIADVVTAAMAYADEVVVVDDGSTDGTHQAARTADAMVLRHEENRGYGATLGTIFQYARRRDAAHLVILDADGQHDVSDIPDLVSTQQKTEVEIVTGSRFSGSSKSEIPHYRRFGLGVINLFTNFGLRIGYAYQPVSDTQCGFRAYDRTAIESMAETGSIGDGMGASLDIIFQAAQEGYEIIEVPTRINYDVEDASTRNPVIHGIDLLTSLFASVTRDRPFRVASAGLCVLFTAGLFVFAIGQFGFTTVLGPITVVAIFLVVLNVAQSSGPREPSDRTDR